MAEVKWIKLDTSMFDNAKIKFIRTLPQGNDILLIWIMILVRAGKCNAGGYIFLTENIPYTDTTLSHELDMPPNVIKLALETFKKLDMITQDEKGFTYITGWSEHQNFEGMEKIREQNRIRKQKQREKQKILPDNHVMSRDSHATDIDKEVDIDNSSSNSSISRENKKGEEDDYYDFKIDEIFKRAAQAYQNNGFGSIYPGTVDNDYTIEWLEMAFKKAAELGKRNLAYVEGILKGWKSDGQPSMEKKKPKETNTYGIKMYDFGGQK